MYIPKKPAKYGIKIQCIADSATSYLYNAYIYTGKDSDGVVLSDKERKLMKPTQSCKPIERSNRNITTDKQLSSLELMEELGKRKLTFVGTMKKNKAVIPPEFKSDKRRPVGSALYKFTNDQPTTLLSIVPKINRTVVLISSTDTDKN